jgi:hypothetical protein
VAETDADERSEELDSPADDDEREDLLKEHLSDSSQCSGCGEPVDNLRKTCPHCGHEYSEDELDDTEAGNEFKAGAALDDEGNEITDEEALED